MCDVLHWFTMTATAVDDDKDMPCVFDGSGSCTLHITSRTQAVIDKLTEKLRLTKTFDSSVLDEIVDILYERNLEKGYSKRQAEINVSLERIIIGANLQLLLNRRRHEKGQ